MRKSKKKSENTTKQMKIKTHLPKSKGCNKSNFKRKVYSDTVLPQERIKISNKLPNIPFKGIRKRRANKATVSQQKEG